MSEMYKLYDILLKIGSTPTHKISEQDLVNILQLKRS